MSLISEAFKGLYGRELELESKLRYSGRFKPYGANAFRSGSYVEIRLGREWKPVSDDIKMGLVQELLLKLFKGKANTDNIDMYNSFIKKLHIAIPKDNVDPLLRESFDRVNDKYFFGLVEMPNLMIGPRSRSTLGNYNFKTDTIKISSILKKNQELMDYVMYHEVLHKKNKFNKSGSKTYYHTSKFRNEERQFENQEEVENKLKWFLRFKF